MKSEFKYQFVHLTELYKRLRTLTRMQKQIDVHAEGLKKKTINEIYFMWNGTRWIQSRQI